MLLLRSSCVRCLRWPIEDGRKVSALLERLRYRRAESLLMFDGTALRPFELNPRLTSPVRSNS